MDRSKIMKNAGKHTVKVANIDPKMAQSINLLSSIPMTIFALIIHIKNKNVVFSLVIPIAVFGVLGAIFGSFIANYLSSEILKIDIQSSFKALPSKIFA